MKSLKVLTCTPVAFKGDHTFFARESESLSRVLRMAGVESFAVMAVPARGGGPDCGCFQVTHLITNAIWAKPKAKSAEISR
jgi:hypothetical protein